MPRYEVEVKVTYRVNAESIEDATNKIEMGAEFPVIPWDDETYCSEVDVVQVKPL